MKKRTFNTIKIISGYLKGRNITLINHVYLRPTLHRIRETLFNWIEKKIYNANCLDCFSGSGALSIESISRYAKYVTLIENNKKILNNIKKNIKKLNIQNIEILNVNALVWLKKTYQKYDIIFLDPPYYNNILQKSITIIDKNNLIKNTGYIYIEKDKKKNIHYPKTWYIHKKKSTSNIDYSIYIYRNE
ncbi:16S rRNA (guanine(966)-N(2))-methyltransferase RsmD [Buchnera aphidicola]|uniref:16S rRNA (guanine(966)-N(2))-methyltransferase RsmD n=1 Tax=Buchnera aphidicola TaxID=9 RepID=UPI003464AD91